MKTTSKIILGIALALTLLILSLPTLIKQYITDHSKELIGRKVDLDDLNFNLLTFSVRMTNIKVYERNEKAIFASIKELYLDFSPWRLRDDVYAVSEISFDGLFMNIIMANNGFNFDDLLESKKDKNTQTTKPIQYVIQNISFKNSSLAFFDEQANKHVKFDNLKLRLPELAWDNKQSDVGIDFNLGEKGKLYLNGMVNHTQKSYSINIKVDDFDLSSIKDYATDHVNIGELQGTLWFDYTLQGSLSEIEDMVLSGTGKIKDFGFTDINNQTLATVKEINADLLYFKPTRSAYYFKTVKLTQPHVAFAYDKTSNNWSKLLVDKPNQPTNPNLTYIIRSLIIENGTAAITDNSLEETFTYEMKDANATANNIASANEKLLIDFVASMKMPELVWDESKQKMTQIAFKSTSEKLTLSGTVDQQKKQYTVNAQVNNLDIQLFKNQLSKYANFDNAQGKLALNYTIEGQFENNTNLTISGTSQINNLVVTDKNQNTLTSINTIDANLAYYKPNQDVIFFSSIELSQPHVNYIVSKKGTNWDGFFTPTSSHNVEPQSEPEKSNFSYHIETILINNGSIAFKNDTLNRAFQYKINNINASINQISSQDRTSFALFTATLNNEGSIEGNTSFNLKQTKRLSIDAKIKNLQLSTFSPYSEYNFGRPIVNGLLTYDFSLDMDVNRMDNKNHLVIAKPVFGEKTKDATAANVPIKIAFNLLKDKNDVVTIDLPLKGNPSDPKFKLSEEIKRAFKDYLTKAATQSVKKVGTTVTETVTSFAKIIETLELKYGESKIPFKQEELLSRMVSKLNESETYKLTFIHVTNATKEKEALALQEVKIRYLVDRTGAKQTNTKLFKVQLSLLSDNKPALIAYINQNSKASSNATINEKCMDIVGEASLNSLFNQLVKERKEDLQTYLSSALKLSAKDYDIKMDDFTSEENLRAPRFDVSKVSLGNRTGATFE